MLDNERLQQLYAEQKQLHKVLNKVRLNEVNREIYNITQQLKQQERQLKQLERENKFHNTITKYLELKGDNK